MRDFHFPGRSPVLALNGMVATSHPLAASEALACLREGGSAMDAAICGALVMSLCEPHMCGLAGDCFALIKPAGADRVIGFNGSGRAPASADAARLRAEGHATIPDGSADAVTIPGAVDAFCRLSEAHGRLGIDRLLQPAIRHAEAGVPVAARVGFDWPNKAPRLQGAARDYYLRDGQPLAPGALFRAPGQAEVMRRIARDGARGFYEGEVAEDMLAALGGAGGSHTAEDFAGTRGEETTPITGQYRATEVFEHPPNGQGATALLLLNILAQFDLSAMDPFGAARTHLEAEASKLAYDTRNRLIADPEVSDATARMCSPELAAELAARIDPARAQPARTRITEQVHRDTIYITAVDRDGMAVSLIHSIFHSFGSGLASPKFGLLLHNRGCGFTLEAGHPNELAPGRRPLHTIIPGMLGEAGRVSMPFGVMGGQYQACGHARFVTNLRDFGMDPQSAIDAPRAFVDDGRLQLERGYAPEVAAKLAALGHDVVTPDEPIGGAQAIAMRDEGVLEGASDPRKDGCAIGY
ncbi:gamma-glutamyltransferase family protein [Marinovum sp.]|uniref:gamma-glutamyltransferase family protein n=1 Tax=Marinovum sp. TaxID=2024839 RepID=UPI002B274EAC|nr:gamma-glutamyltransferase family protein [Marinovum sp.]